MLHKFTNLFFNLKRNQYKYTKGTGNFLPAKFTDNFYKSKTNTIQCVIHNMGKTPVKNQ